MKIKLLIVALAVFLTPLIGVSQVDIFEKYNNNSDVTYVSISPKMFQMIAEMGIDVEDVEAKAYMDMVKSISSFKTLKTDKSEITAEIQKWVKSKSNLLQELMVVKENGTEVKFFVKDGADSEHVKELLIFMNGISDVHGGDIETTVMLLTGNINLNELSKLTSKMNIPGGEHLNKKR